MYESFFLGVISSLAAGAITWAYAEWLRPLLAFTRGGGINGRWQLLYPREDGQGEFEAGTVLVKQVGRRAWATITLSKDRHGEEEVRTFFYQGTYDQAGNLIMTWHDKEAPTEFVGALVLRLTDVPGRMEGKTVFPHRKQAEVVTRESVWQRPVRTGLDKPTK